MNCNIKAFMLLKLLLVLWILPVFAENSPTPIQQYVENMLIGSSKDDEPMIMENKAILESLPKTTKLQNELARKLNLDALSFIKANNFVDAIPLLAKAYDLDSSDIEISNNYGFALMKSRDLDKAYSVLANVLTIKPDRTSAWRNLADVIALKGQVNLAEAGYLNAYRFSKNIQKTHKLLQNPQLRENSPFVQEAMNNANERATKLFFSQSKPRQTDSFTETNKFINTANPGQKDESNDTKRIDFIEQARRELDGEYTNGLRNETFYIPEEPEELAFIAEQLAIDDNTSQRHYGTSSTKFEDTKTRIETEMMDSVCPCTVAEVLALRVMRRERGFTDSVAKMQQLLLDKPPGGAEEGFNNIRNAAARFSAQIESIIKVKEAYKATHPKVSLTQYGEVIPYQGVPNKKYSDAILARENNRPVHKIHPYYQ